MHSDSVFQVFLEVVYISYTHQLEQKAHHDFIILGLTVSQDQNITNKASAASSTNKKVQHIVPSIEMTNRTKTETRI